MYTSNLNCVKLDRMEPGVFIVLEKFDVSEDGFTE